MSNSNGIITPPVTIEDVKTVLGLLSINDLGTLCTTDRINMWSRMKPVHIRGAISHERTGNWWKGTFGDCGIDLFGAVASLYTQIPGKYTSDKKNGWGYTPPFGGEVSPFRLQDFENYWHDAPAPIFNFTVTDKVAQGKKIYARCMVGATTEGDKKESAGALTFADIAAAGASAQEQIYDLGDFYFGIVITDTIGNVVGRVAGPEKASAGGCEFLVGNNFRLNTEYWVYPFLSSSPQPQNETDVLSAYYTIPNVERAKFKVVSLEEYADLNIFIKAVKTTSQDIDYELNITTSSSITVLSGYIAARYTTGLLNIGEPQVSLGNFTVTSSKPYTKSGTFAGLLDDKRYQVVLYLRTNLGEFNRSVYPIEGAIPPDILA